MTDEKSANLDLCVEQAKQRVMLEQLGNDVREIKEALVGSSCGEGLLTHVDRLKQTDKRRTAALWVMFTAVVGVFVNSFTRH